ncbi:hypothetical protein U9M48_044380 [Paspalum notatum var. saurae]|uniref:Uncharacterized protein n=1 Tax=Paspalum notatum var. saurae TaxID=547442 RepID=A0AAQ3XGN0_PASNO
MTGHDPVSSRVAAQGLEEQGHSSGSLSLIGAVLARKPGVRSPCACLPPMEQRWRPGIGRYPRPSYACRHQRSMPSTVDIDISNHGSKCIQSSAVSRYAIEHKRERDRARYLLLIQSFSPNFKVYCPRNAWPRLSWRSLYSDWYDTLHCRTICLCKVISKEREQDVALVAAFRREQYVALVTAFRRKQEKEVKLKATEESI